MTYRYRVNMGTDKVADWVEYDQEFETLLEANLACMDKLTELMPGKWLLESVSCYDAWENNAPDDEMRSVATETLRRGFADNPRWSPRFSFRSRDAEIGYAAGVAFKVFDPDSDICKKYHLGNWRQA